MDVNFIVNLVRRKQNKNVMVAFQTDRMNMCIDEPELQIINVSCIDFRRKLTA